MKYMVLWLLFLAFDLLAYSVVPKPVIEEHRGVYMIPGGGYLALSVYLARGARP